MSFITAQHPKTSISPEKIHVPLNSGWCAQVKINGMYDQMHIYKGQVSHYTRHGKIHTRKVSDNINSQLIEHFGTEGLSVLVGEWHQKTDTLYLFDILVDDGVNLKSLTYKSRYDLLWIRHKILPNIKFLKKSYSKKECSIVLEGDEKIEEGLVFKNENMIGWNNSSIVRCLKEGERGTK